MSRRLPLLVVAALACASTGCPPEQSGPDPRDELRTRVLTSVADEIILPTLRSFADASETLADACAAWAAESPPGEASAARTSAQAAFHGAMELWQEAELLQVGPAGAMGKVMGGQDLRDEIYSFPTTNPCGVDEELVENVFRDAGFFEREAVNRAGLAVLEYLLFVEGDANACAAARPINAEGTWTALGSDEIRQRRADYCAAASAHLVADAQRLRDAWEESDGDFRAQLVAPGGADAVYASPSEALDALYQAIFYLELVVKDRKLAVPAGLHVLCATESCPELVESPYAKRSKENIAANLRAFEKIFLGQADPDGSDGAGFDDLLADANAGELAEDMKADIDAAEAALAAFEGSLEDALVSDVERARALYATVKVVTDDLKTQLPSVLGLRVPQEGAGDND